MAFKVYVKGGFAEEVAGLWCEWLKANPDAMYRGRELWATAEKRPQIVQRNAILGKLKAMAEHEFGKEVTLAKWNQDYTIEVTTAKSEKLNFAGLSPYGDGVDWGPAVIKELGWTVEVANRKYASFHR